MRQDALSLLVHHGEFFSQCAHSSDPTHSSHSSREVQRNHFDLTSGESLCAVCLSLDPEIQNTIQVRTRLIRKIDPRPRKDPLRFFRGTAPARRGNSYVTLHCWVPTGPPLILSRCGQGCRHTEACVCQPCAELRDQRLESVLPQASPTAPAAKGCCRCQSVHCLFQALAGCQLVLFYAVHA